MGKVKVFQILLDKVQPIYMVGEVVSGTMYVEISKRLKINTLKLSFTGGGRVHWTETRTASKSGGSEETETGFEVN